MAGAGGIEPPNTDTKNQCLTAWRRPINCGAVFKESTHACKALFVAFFMFYEFSLENLNIIRKNLVTLVVYTKLFGE